MELELRLFYQLLIKTFKNKNVYQSSHYLWQKQKEEEALAMRFRIIVHVTGHVSIVNDVCGKVARMF